MPDKPATQEEDMEPEPLNAGHPIGLAAQLVVQQGPPTPTWQKVAAIAAIFTAVGGTLYGNNFLLTKAIESGDAAGFCASATGNDTDADIDDTNVWHIDESGVIATGACT